MATKAKSIFKKIIYWSLKYLVRFALLIVSLWILAIIAFKFLPVPYSTVMLQKRFTAWSAGKTNYSIRQTWVPMNRISPNMALAVIAAEDQKFPDHNGFDFDAIFSIIKKSKGDKPMRGASTLSQQTAKNLFLWNGHSWVRKGLEFFLTSGIEFVWGKQQILTVYLNIAEFGEGIFGVEQAARTYFNKSAKELTAEESALLAAVLPNPIIFKVNKPSNSVKQRQAWILNQMEQLGGIKLIKRLH